MDNLSYQLFEVGHCRHCERVTRQSGRLKSTSFPANVALIKHPTKGHILFDTGYSRRFFDLTKHFPFSLYRYLTPVHLETDLKQQLKQKNISADSIDYIILSHLHADHIGGVQDFPNAKLILHPDALLQSKQLNRWQGLLRGFLPKLLPDDYTQRIHPMGEVINLPESLNPFQKGFDLFSDGSIILIELPGHARGQIGAIINAQPNAFLIADSCWHIDAIVKDDLPSKITALVHDNWQQYVQTISDLRQLVSHNKQIELIPSHCTHTLERLR